MKEEGSIRRGHRVQGMGKMGEKEASRLDNGVLPFPLGNFCSTEKLCEPLKLWSE